MKAFEDLRKYLDQNVRKCWRCGIDLTEMNVKYRYSPEIECPQCGLIVELTTRIHRRTMLVFAGLVLGGLIGFIVGSIV